MNQADCPENYTYKDSTDPSNDVGKPSCLVLGEWENTDITTRYQNLQCSTVNPYTTVTNTILKYHTQFLAYQSDVNQLFANITGELQILNSKFVDIGNKTAIQAEKVKIYFDDDLGAFLQTLFNSQTGLVSELNCKFVRRIYDDLHTSVCTNVVPSMLIIFTFSTLLCFCAILLLFANLYLSKRLRKPNLLQF